MAVNTVNTRLILRNDALSSWNNSDKILLKGEAALALHTANDDAYKNRYEIRIGDGEHAFSALAPTNIVFPWDAISGAPAAATYQLSVSEDNLSACVISTDVNNSTTGTAGAVFSLQGLSDAISAKVIVKDGQTSSAIDSFIINKVSEDTYAQLKADSQICADQLYTITGNTSSTNNFGMPLISVASPSADSPDHWAATKGYADSISTSLSGTLSNAWEGNLSAATTANPLILSSDISGLIAKGVTFGGVYADPTAVSNLTAAIPGQVYVLTGNGYNGKEYICLSTDGTDGIGPGHPTIVEIGDEGAIADIADKMISAVNVGGNAVTIADHTLNLSAFALKDSTNLALSDLSVISANSKIGLSTAAEVRDAISGDIKTGLNLKQFAYDGIASADLTLALDGAVGLSTASQVSGAISSAISSSLNLGALAHKDTVGTADIDDAAVTSAKIAPSSVTRDHLSGWFVLSCGDAVQDGNILTSDVYNS